MINLSLQRADGKEIKIQIPESANEIKLSQKLSFDFENIKVLSYLKKYEENIYRKRGQYSLVVAKGLSKILDLDISVLFELDGRSLLQINEEEFVKQVYGKIDLDQIGNNLISIWNFLFNVIYGSEKLDSKISSVEYKGQTYKLPTWKIDPITNKPKYESINYQQAIETLQVNNNYLTWKEKHKELEESEEAENWLFSKYISEVVLLLHNDMPEDEDEFESWLNEKRVHFQDIDWATCQYLEQWFNSFIGELRNDPENRYFFEGTYEPGNAEEREAMDKAKSKSKKIYEAVGLKSVLSRLLELNPFQKPGQSKKESILKAKFPNVTKIISLDNASKA